MRILQVDAFTGRAFAGNPAGVVLLDAPRDERWMQAVAAEMNLPETAFTTVAGSPRVLRWFTPTVEVPLCGHATLATAHALWELGLAEPGEELVFTTKSGELRAGREGGEIALDLPAYELHDLPGDVDVRAVAKAEVRDGVWLDDLAGDRTLLLDLADEQAVRGYTLDEQALRASGYGGLVLTARAAGPDATGAGAAGSNATGAGAAGSGAAGSDDTAGYDIVSRCFFPFAGIGEDPVTGAAHCALAPYWAPRLGRDELRGLQASARGGLVGMRLLGDRVRLTGQAVTAFEGTLRV